MPSSTSTSSLRILIQDIHISAAHAVQSTMMAILADSYHLLGARRLVKSLSQHCVKCQWAYCRTSSQLMGQLPVERFHPSSPFFGTGIDFAGPFLTKRGSLRCPVKVY